MARKALAVIIRLAGQAPHRRGRLSSNVRGHTQLATFTRHWVNKGSGPKPDDFGDHFFLHEIQMQCDFGVRAYGEMRQLHQANAKNPSLLALAHAMLVFAGNAAKLLSAPKSASAQMKARAVRLRSHLNLANLDLSRIADARNYLEHFDERIERYLQIPGGIVFHRLIQDHEPLEVTLEDGRTLKPRILQLLNTSDWYLSLHGDRIQLIEVASLLEQIQASVHTYMVNAGMVKESSAP
ncbi:MAG: hypothetical protein IPI47_09740 [Piscinibacter sp.]|nr:hypothetical protein [Piscinibacter sp.]MBP6542384.1 hypothetical protein [Piscinibacter sp.]